jgi:hyperpolarization activated cyclic nucleotide-gated potassium channel 2
VQVILDASEIARRYVRGSFLIDFISSMPVDHITVLLQGGNPREATVWSTASTLKVLRFARLLSLLRLLKVTRLFRSMRTIQEYLNIGSGLLRIINLILVMLLVAHWNGCIQFFIAQLEGFPDESWVAINDLQDASPGEQYAWSIFKALSHMLCIGYVVHIHIYRSRYPSLHVRTAGWYRDGAST